MHSTRHSHGDSGLATVEFAIVGSLLLMLVFGIMSVGLLIYNTVRASDDARVEARDAALACTAEEIQAGTVKKVSKPVTVTWFVPFIDAPTISPQEVSYRCGG